MIIPPQVLPEPLPILLLEQMLPEPILLMVSIAELIVFSKSLSLIEQQKIETYLGIKYGIHLAHNYLASNYDGTGTGTQATPLWDGKPPIQHIIIM